MTLFEKNVIIMAFFCYTIGKYNLWLYTFFWHKCNLAGASPEAKRQLSFLYHLLKDERSLHIILMQRDCKTPLVVVFDV